MPHSRKSRKQSKALVPSACLVATLALACGHGSSAFRVPSSHPYARSSARVGPSNRSFLLLPLFAEERKIPIEADQELSTLTQASEYPNMALEFNTEDGNDKHETPQQRSGFSYGTFAQTYPFVNNVGIATVKTAAADLLAQTVIAQTPLDAIDWQRSFLFCLFGATYLGGFQYWYQVNIFKQLFDVDKFTQQTWSEKVNDREGLKALATQTALDLGVLTAIYLPTFYIFKASVFGGSADPMDWATLGFQNYQTNFAKDEWDLIRVWFPADLVCFSVPLYLRLPVRHIVSFVWTAYLSFARGGH